MKINGATRHSGAQKSSIQWGTYPKMQIVLYNPRYFVHWNFLHFYRVIKTISMLLKAGRFFIVFRALLRPISERKKIYLLREVQF